nr:penicillin-binding protein 2 (PBP-2) [Raoultella sp. NCTC 9187]
MKGYKRRYYPYNSALTHVIGYVSKINDKDVDRLDKEGKLANYASTHDIGKLGIERYYEDVCTGRPATRRSRSTTAAASFVSSKRCRRRPGAISI